MTSLQDSMTILLDSLVKDFSPGCLSLVLTGSWARGDATPYSDIDLHRFVPTLPPEDGHYTLFFRRGRLVSLSHMTFEEQTAQMRQPQHAILAVPGLRQARALFDPQGLFAALQAEVASFQWEPLQPAADRYASRQVMGYAEEVFKLLGALTRRDEATIHLSIYGLVLGLSRTVITQAGRLLETENQLFSACQQVCGLDSAWTEAFRQASGLGPLPGERPIWQERGEAGLALYCETVDRFEAILLPEDHRVAAAAVQAIQSTLDE